MSNLNSSPIDTPGLNIGIDFDRNDFICWEARPTDKLNTTPTYGLPADDYFYWKTTNILGGVSIAYAQVNSLYGLKGLGITCDTTNSNGVIIGKDGAATFNFTGLTNGRVYTVQIAVRRSNLEANGSRPMRMQLRTQSDTVTAATADFDLTTVDQWYIVRANFTADASSSNLCIRVFKNGLAATAITYDISGVMVFNETAAVAQQGFNLGTAVSLNENINHRNMTAQTAIGMRPFARMGDENTATLLCNNDDRFFSQEYTGSPIYGYLITHCVIVIRYGTERYYVGYVDTCNPKPFLYGERTATITCFGLKRYMEKARADIEYAASQRVDEYMVQVLEDYDSNIDPGGIQQAQTTLAYYGDNAYDEEEEDINVYAAFAQLNNLEQGWFFINADGEPEMFDRHYTVGLTSSLTIDNTAQGIEYAPFGEYLLNRVKIKVYPRNISSVTTDLLWELDQDQLIKQGRLRRFKVPYTNSQARRCGATDVQTPAGADYVVSGGAAPSLSITKYGQFARIVLDNGGGIVDVTVTTLNVRGRAITYLNPIEVVAEDATSIASYGIRELVLDMKGLKDVNEGDDIANFILLLRGQLRGDVKSVTLIAGQDSADADIQRAVTIGGVITVVDDQLYHDQRYLVVGVSHSYSENLMLTSKYNLEAVAADQYWILGTSELGINTGLAY